MAHPLQISLAEQVCDFADMGDARQIFVEQGEWFVLRQVIGLAMAAFLLASCGGGPVSLATPADGTNYPMSAGYGGYQQPIYVTVADNYYSGITIRAIGIEKVPGLQCSGGNETYLICQLYPSNGGGGFNQMAVVKFEATRGDYKDIRVVTFGGMQTTTTPPR